MKRIISKVYVGVPQNHRFKHNSYFIALHFLCFLRWNALELQLKPYKLFAPFTTAFILSFSLCHPVWKCVCWRWITEVMEILQPNHRWQVTWWMTLIGKHAVIATTYHCTEGYNNIPLHSYRDEKSVLLQATWSDIIQGLP
jgi:hypothetical protein